MSIKSLRAAPLVVGAALIAAVFTSGCSQISSGIVTGKRHSPAYTYTQMVCTSYNDKGMCTSSYPAIHYVDERWTLDLKKDGKTGWVDVTAAGFEACDIESIYPKCDKTQKEQGRE